MTGLTQNSIFQFQKSRGILRVKPNIIIKVSLHSILINIQNFEINSLPILEVAGISLDYE